MTCCRCGREMVTTRQWRRLPSDLRRGVRHEARGMCAACYSAAKYAGPNPPAERTRYRHDELLAEWDILRRQGYDLRNAAVRLGITPGALDRALVRAKAAGDERAHRTPTGDWGLPRGLVRNATSRRPAA